MLNIFSTNYFYDGLKSIVGSMLLGKNYERDGGDESGRINDNTTGLARNNPFVASIQRAYVRGVSPVQFNIQSYTKDTNFNEEFEKWIKLWSKKGNCELSGRYYRGDIERALVREYSTNSGGLILRDHYSENFKCGYKVELIPTYLISLENDSLNDNTINGIETNKNGEIIAIHIYTDINNGQQATERVDYKELTLITNKWADVSQYTPVSPVAPIVESLEFVDSYSASELLGAKKMADNAIFIKTPYFSQLLKAGKDNVLVNLVNGIFEKRRLDLAEDSSFTYLDENENIEVPAKGTRSVYEYLYPNETRAASSAVGLTSSSTVGEKSSSYNEALRGVQQEEREYKSVFEGIIENGWREIIETKLLKGLILKGVISPKNYWEAPEEYEHIQFMREEVVHIDPIKTAKSNTESLINGSLTKREMLAKKGKDLKDDIEIRINDMLLEKKMYNDAGLIWVQPNIQTTLEDKDLLEEEEINA